MRVYISPPIPLLLASLVAASPCAAQDSSETGNARATAPLEVATFGGEVEVSVINLHVTVLDEQGHPMTGLTRGNFEVYERDEMMEITNFSEIRRPSEGGLPPRDEGTATSEARLGKLVATPGEHTHIALLFDNLSLEKRNRKRILREINEFVLECTRRHDRVLVATTGEEFRIVEPFGDDEGPLVRALESLANTPTQGDLLGSRVRLLNREILSSELIQNEANRFASQSQSGGGTGGTPQPPPSEISPSVDREMVMIRSARFLAQIEQHRQEELIRIARTLQGIHELVRALSALPGRKHLMWFGEGLVMQPGLDVYQTFYTKFANWADDINIDRPDVWSQGHELLEAFTSVATAAQVAGTTLHVIDATSRDRNKATGAFTSVDSNAFFATEDGGSRLGVEYNIADLQRLQHGARYLADATGGTYFAATRDFQGHFDLLHAILGSYYSIGYMRPSDPNALLRPVRIELPDMSARIRHQEQVVERTPTQRLADEVLSRLRFGTGNNPLEISLALAENEPVDDSRYIQTLKISFPTDKLTMVGGGESHTDSLLLVFQALKRDGFTRPPQLMPLIISIPAARLEPGATAQAKVRLVLETDTARVAVGALEHTSGAEATTLIEVASAADP